MEKGKMEVLVKNIIKCKSCNDIIESTHRYDFKYCKCGKVAVDGGLDYAKRVFPNMPMEDWFEDLSVYEDEDND
ncbi:DUF7695 domain-containing protein [Bacillus sp. JJ722]|uniref:DUF7695 domain-containing protein n=1 Tax=Bacillus sp. JJ722 TaxID=3122973 RepID=UPI003000B67C